MAFFIIIAAHPDDLHRARNSGQTAVLMFLDLSTLLGRSGQHVLLTHPPASSVDGCVSAGFGHAPGKSYGLFSFQVFLKRTLALPHPVGLDAPSIFLTLNNVTVLPREGTGFDMEHFTVPRMLLLITLHGCAKHSPRIWGVPKA